MKKFLILAMSICSPLFADMSCDDGYFNGFYVGVSGGIATNMTDTKMATSVDFSGFNPTVETLQSSRKNKLYKISPWGEIFAGWGIEYACYYLGTRFGVNFSYFNPKSKSKTANLDPDDENDAALLRDSLKTKMWTAEYTFDAKPGIVFCKRTLFFGILGAAVNKKHLKSGSRFSVGPGFFANRTGVSKIKIDKERTFVGFRGGLGIEYMLTECLSLQLNYIYTYYWRLKDRIKRNYVDSQGATFPHLVKFSSRASKQVSSIGLAYYF